MAVELRSAGFDFQADSLWRCFSLQCCLDTPKDIEHMSGQRFVNMMASCQLPRRPDLSGPALRVVATAAARGHVTKQNYDRGPVSYTHLTLPTICSV